MSSKEQIEIEILKNLSHASDMLCYDARNLKQSLSDEDARARIFSVQRRLESLHQTLDIVLEQLVTLKLIDKL